VQDRSAASGSAAAAISDMRAGLARNLQLGAQDASWALQNAWAAREEALQTVASMRAALAAAVGAPQAQLAERAIAVEEATLAQREQEHTAALAQYAQHSLGARLAAAAREAADDDSPSARGSGGAAADMEYTPTQQAMAAMIRGLAGDDSEALAAQAVTRAKAQGAPLVHVTVDLLTQVRAAVREREAAQGAAAARAFAGTLVDTVAAVKAAVAAWQGVTSGGAARARQGELVRAAHALAERCGLVEAGAEAGAGAPEATAEPAATGAADDVAAAEVADTAAQAAAKQLAAQQAAEAIAIREEAAEKAAAQRAAAEDAESKQAAAEAVALEQDGAESAAAEQAAAEQAAAESAAEMAAADLEAFEQAAREQQLAAEQAETDKASADELDADIADRAETLRLLNAELDALQATVRGLMAAACFRPDVVLGQATGLCYLWIQAAHT
jgi:pilus assembly protein FimV